MPTTDDVAWFKQQFKDKINTATAGTPFTLNMLAALACQESGEVWPILRKHQLSTQDILALCVGDTIDAPGRGTFPETKAELVTTENGAQMFDIAHQALVDMAQHITAYQKIAQRANKFCHGFGIFQYDIQFFLDDPAFFLNKRYADFDACLSKVLGELSDAIKRAKLQDKPILSDLEMAAVAIAYNTGSFKPSLGLKQGFQSDDGKFYGEQYFDYLRMAQSVTVGDDNTVTIVAPANGTALIPPPTPIEATGDFFEVDVMK